MADGVCSETDPLCKQFITQTASTPIAFITSVAGYGTLQNSTSFAVGAVQQKLAAVDAATKSAPVPDPLSEGPGAKYLNPVADVGLASNIAQVRNDFVVDMNADSAIMEGTSEPGNLLSAVSSVYASSVLSKAYAEAQAGWNAQVADPGYTPYTGHNFVVDAWQGVVVTPTGATLLVMGHKSYLVNGAWSDDPSEQHQATLLLEDGHYKIVSLARVRSTCSNNLGDCADSVSAPSTDAMVPTTPWSGVPNPGPLYNPPAK